MESLREIKERFGNLTTTITILKPENDKHLYKTFDVIEDELIQTKADMPYKVKSEEYKINVIDDFQELLEYLNDNNMAIIRGTRINKTDNYVRRLSIDDKEDKATFKDIPQSWLGIDIDDVLLEDIDNYQSVEAINKYITKYLPKEFHRVSYCYHFSGSSGISYKDKNKKNGLACHIFFVLHKGVISSDVKLWLADEIANKRVDGSHYQPVQLLYCTQAKILNDEISDYFKLNDIPRIGLVFKKIDIVKVPRIEKPKIEIPEFKNQEYKQSELMTKKIVSKLSEISTIDWDDWCNLGWAMANNDYDYDDFVSLSLSYLNSRGEARATISDIQRTWSRSDGRPESGGVIINIIKKYIGDDMSWMKPKRITRKR